MRHTNVRPFVMSYQKIFALSLIFIPMLSIASPIYKSIDNEGNVTYSDQARPNSEQIIINVPNTIASPSKQHTESLDSEANVQDEKKINQYEISIIEPVNESVFSTDIEKIHVNVSTQPNLSENDYVALKINDKIYKNAPGVTLFTLGRLDRGSYQLQAFVYSQGDTSKIKGQSEVITIHQIRATIIPSLQ